MQIENNEHVVAKGMLQFTKYEPVYIRENGILRPATLEETPLCRRAVTWKGPQIQNLIVISANYGLNLVAQSLIGLTTYPLEITQGKIGTGTTTPTNADTDLETTTLSGILRANQSHALGVAEIQFFIADSELTNGTYNEFGIFCGAQLFARSIISPAFTKATSEDTGIDYTLTFTNT